MNPHGRPTAANPRTSARATRRAAVAALAAILVGVPARALADGFDTQDGGPRGLAAPTTTVATFAAPPTTRPALVAAPTTAPVPPTTVPGQLVTETVPPTTAPVLVTPTPDPTTPGNLVSPTTTVPDPDSGITIGEVDPGGGVPDGLDLTAIPGLGDLPLPDGGPQLAAGFTCEYQCIESGVAYARGFGALLVVRTHVPADVTLIVISDGDGDGDYEFNHIDYSAGLVEQHSLALDHLVPGQTYYVTVVATDANNDTSHAFGEFTTLSERTVQIELGDVDIIGGPNNIVARSVSFDVDGMGLTEIPEGITGAFWGTNLDRFVDLSLLVEQQWETSGNTVCEVSGASLDWPTGSSDDTCSTWNTAYLVDLDLDVVPVDRSHWTELSFDATMVSPSGEGDALPPGFGTPRYFGVSAAVEITVTYS